MNKFSLMLVLAAVLMTFSVSAQHRIPIQEDKPVKMFALGAGTKNGVFQFTLTDPANPTKISGSSYISYGGSALGGGGTFLSPEKVVGGKYVYDIYCFEATAEGSGEGAWTSSYYAKSTTIYKVWDMVYDEKSDVVYCWYGVNDYNNCLGIYDTTNHTITRVGNAANTNIWAIAIDKDGQLWGVGTYSLLYKIDKETGKATDVTGGMGCAVQLQSGISSAAVDPASNTLYVVGKVGNYDTVATLFKIDLETYAATTVAKLDGYYNCLYIEGSSIADGAPAPVENLSGSFNGESTVISFTAPSLTAGGKTLTGELTYTVTVDGEEAATGTVAAGADKNVYINPADGSHEIAVSVSNAAGTSKVVKATIYCGYDQPGNISGLKAVVEDNDVTLSWTAPTGKNGGTLDMSKLSYKVTRNGEVIASDLTETTLKNVIDSYYSEKIYKVTVVYGDVEGESMSTSLMVGKPYEIPFNLNLADAETIGEAGITVLDPNNGNSVASGTWTLVKNGDDTYIESFSTYMFMREDFAWLPLTSLKAGVTYTLSFKAAAKATNSTGMSKMAVMRVVLADKPTMVESEYKVLKQTEVAPTLDAYEWGEYALTFSVEKDGDYSLGLMDYAAEYYNYYYLAAKDFSIVTNLTTPKAVTDLEAAATGETNRDIVLTFTLPTQDTDGKTLSSLTKVVIYRGNDVIATLDDVKPGEEIIYTDENAPRGFKSYRVIVFNGDKASAAAVTTISVGYLNNLQVEMISYPESAVEPYGESVITVKVTNDGFDQVLYGAYTVALLANGEQVAAQVGEGLATDESKDYSFELFWNGDMPATVSYVVKVYFNGDEKTEDNETAPVSVRFDTQSGLDEAVAAEIGVSACDRVITVRGAEGKTVNVYTADGRLVFTAISGAELSTPALPAGMYLVDAGGKSVKVAL